MRNDCPRDETRITLGPHHLHLSNDVQQLAPRPAKGSQPVTRQPIGLPSRLVSPEHSNEPRKPADVHLGLQSASYLREIILVDVLGGIRVCDSGSGCNCLIPQALPSDIPTDDSPPDKRTCATEAGGSSYFRASKPVASPPFSPPATATSGQDRRMQQYRPGKIKNQTHT